MRHPPLQYSRPAQPSGILPWEIKTWVPVVYHRVLDVPWTLMISVPGFGQLVPIPLASFLFYWYLFPNLTDKRLVNPSDFLMINQVLSKGTEFLPETLILKPFYLCNPTIFKTMNSVGSNSLSMKGLHHQIAIWN